MKRWLWLGLLVALAPARAAVDHAPFDALLREHVTDGRVDYEAIAGDARLATYLRSLAGADPAAEPSDAARLALYLNAYNAFVLKGVIDHQPLTSVTKVRGFFDTLRYNLGGAEVTLDEIERERISPFGDARTHAAAVCAARGCPPLRSEAYVAAKLDDQLAEQCRLWVGNPALNRIDRGENTLYVSMVFRWYADDFEPAGGPAGFIRLYLANEADRSWLADGGYQLKFLEHDWTLNGR